MGFSHKCQCAARTVLRARATGDQNIIDDAETAVSGYLDEESLQPYLDEHFPHGLDAGSIALSSIEKDPCTKKRRLIENIIRDTTMITATIPELASARAADEAFRSLVMPNLERMNIHDLILVEGMCSGIENSVESAAYSTSGDSHFLPNIEYNIQLLKKVVRRLNAN